MLDESKMHKRIMFPVTRRVCAVLFPSTDNVETLDITNPSADSTDVSGLS